MKKVIIAVLFLCVIPALAFSQIDNSYGKRLIERSDKKVSVDFQGVAMINLFKVISQQSGLNFVASEAVQERTVTLYMEEVPLASAMDILFAANNLSYDYYPDANIFVVKEMGKPSIELMTRIYNLKYARVKNSRLQQEIDDIIVDEDSDSSDDDDIDEGISNAVKQALTENGKVIEDAVTNSLIVIDVPSQFGIIEQIISSLDVPQPKVLIEVEILDVSKRLIDKLGTDWPETIASLNVTGTRLTSFPFSSSSKGDTSSYGFDDVTVTSSALGDLTFSTLGSNHFSPSVLTLIGANLTLNFLKTDSDTKSLARPKILTVSNETAEIKITTDEAIGIEETTDSESGDKDYTIERSETGTRLRVTPQVNRITGEITLIVESVQKEAKTSGFTATANSYISGTIKDPEERSTKAVVRIRNGEVLLLGGLIKNVSTNEESKLPVLGDIPVLGKWLFRSKNGDNQERELLIFITPKIVEEAGIQFSGKGSSLNREQSLVSSKREAIRTSLDKFQRDFNGKTR